MVAAAPTQDAGALVDPAVAGDHLGDPGEPETEEAKSQADREVDQIIVQRQELAVENGEMDEAHAEAQGQHIHCNMPPWPPGRRYRAAGKPSRAAAHQDAHEQEYPERVLVGEEFGDREIHCLLLMSAFSACRLRDRPPSPPAAPTARARCR